METIIRIDSQGEVISPDSNVSHIIVSAEDRSIVQFDEYIELQRSAEGSSVITDDDAVIIQIFEAGPKGDPGQSVFVSGSVALPSGLVSSSAQIVYSGLTGIPAGILSSSAGFVTSDSTSSFALKTEISGAFEVSVSSSYAATASYYALPIGIVSSSAQISNYGFISQSIDIGPLNDFSGSIQLQVGALANSTGSYALKSEISGAYASVVPNLSVSSSYAATASYFRLPSNIISSSGQISAFGFVSESANIADLNIFSESADLRLDALEYSSSYYLTSLPSGIISASGQIASDISGSVTGISSSLAGRISNLENTNVYSGSFSGSFEGSGVGLIGIISASYSQTASYSRIESTLGMRIYTAGTISAGSKGFRHIPRNSQITQARILSTLVGSIDVNLRRNGTILGTIGLQSSTSSIDSVLTGWTTQLNKNDLVEFYVSQSSTLTDITVFIDTI